MLVFLSTSRESDPNDITLGAASSPRHVHHFRRVQVEGVEDLALTLEKTSGSHLVASRFVAA